MNQTWKIVIAIIITTVVVGGGIYYWQNSEQTPTLPQPAIQTTETVTQQENNNPTYSDQDISFKYLKDYKIVRQNNNIFINEKKLPENVYPDEGSPAYTLSIFKNLKDADQKRNYITENTNSNKNLCLTQPKTDNFTICKFEKTTDEGMTGTGQYYEVISPKNNLWIFIFDKSGNSNFVEKILLPSLKINTNVPATTDKTFEGNGFTFTYPAKYIADSEGLWTEEGYKYHINPPKACDTCQIPEVEIKLIFTAKTTEQQILTDYGLGLKKTLAERIKDSNISYGNTVKIGNNDFMKIMVSDMFDVISYYTKHDNQIVAFRVYFKEKDNQELKDMISTLKFK